MMVPSFTSWGLNGPDKPSEPAKMAHFTFAPQSVPPVPVASIVEPAPLWISPPWSSRIAVFAPRIVPPP
jgi:hypothetical protein